MYKIYQIFDQIHWK